jgi:hypothetical protein
MIACLSKCHQGLFTLYLKLNKNEIKLRNGFFFWKIEKRKFSFTHDSFFYFIIRPPALKKKSIHFNMMKFYFMQIQLLRTYI